MHVYVSIRRKGEEEQRAHLEQFQTSKLTKPNSSIILVILLLITITRVFVLPTQGII